MPFTALPPTGTPIPRAIDLVVEEELLSRRSTEAAEGTERFYLSELSHAAIEYADVRHTFDEADEVSSSTGAASSTAARRQRSIASWSSSSAWQRSPSAPLLELSSYTNTGRVNRGPLRYSGIRCQGHGSLQVRATSPLAGVSKLSDSSWRRLGVDQGTSLVTDGHTTPRVTSSKLESAFHALNLAPQPSARTSAVPRSSTSSSLRSCGQHVDATSLSAIGVPSAGSSVGSLQYFDDLVTRAQQERQRLSGLQHLPVEPNGSLQPSDAGLTQPRHSNPRCRSSPLPSDLTTKTADNNAQTDEGCDELEAAQTAGGIHSLHLTSVNVSTASSSWRDAVPRRVAGSSWRHPPAEPETEPELERLGFTNYTSLLSDVRHRNERWATPPPSSTQRSQNEEESEEGVPGRRMDNQYSPAASTRSRDLRDRLLTAPLHRSGSGVPPPSPPSEADISRSEGITETLAQPEPRPVARSPPPPPAETHWQRRSALISPCPASTTSSDASSERDEEVEQHTPKRLGRSATPSSATPANWSGWISPESSVIKRLSYLRTRERERDKDPARSTLGGVGESGASSTPFLSHEVTQQSHGTGAATTTGVGRFPVVVRASPAEQRVSHYHYHYHIRVPASSSLPTSLPRGALHRVTCLEAAQRASVISGWVMGFMRLAEECFKERSTISMFRSSSSCQLPFAESSTTFGTSCTQSESEPRTVLQERKESEVSAEPLVLTVSQGEAEAKADGEPSRTAVQPLKKDAGSDEGVIVPVSAPSRSTTSTLLLKYLRQANRFTDLSPLGLVLHTSAVLFATVDRALRIRPQSGCPYHLEPEDSLAAIEGKAVLYLEEVVAWESQLDWDRCQEQYITVTRLDRRLDGTSVQQKRRDTTPASSNQRSLDGKRRALRIKIVPPYLVMPLNSVDNE